MSNRKTFAILLAFAFVILPMATIDTDGAELTVDSASINVGSFNERSSGTISIPIENSSTGDIEVDVYVTWLDGDWTGDKLASAEGIVVPAKTDDGNGRTTIDLSFRISSPGTYQVKVWIMPDTAFPIVESTPFNTQTITINVDSSIWSNTTTYILIVVVVIIVVVALYLRMRSTRVPKSEGRFTEMEQERRMQKERPKKSEYIEAEPARSYDDVPYEQPQAAETYAEAPAETAPAAEVKKPVKAAETKTEVKTEKTKTSEKQEYTGRVSKTKTKQQSAKRKSSPTSRKSSKRK